jgi:hypothetical protein
VEDDPSNPKYLLTDPYVGYRFDDTSLLERGSRLNSQIPTIILLILADLYGFLMPSLSI